MAFEISSALVRSEKVLALPRTIRLEALGLWVAAGAWSESKKHPGFVPGYMVEEFGALPNIAVALVRVGLWKVDDEGYRFVAGSEWRDSNAPVKRAENALVLAAIGDSFERAWKAWPKKAEKKKSAEQYAKAARKIGERQLEEAVTAFGLAYAATTEKKYVPALCFWLSRERWTDELPQPEASQQTRVQQGLSVADELRQMEAGHAGQ